MVLHVRSKGDPVTLLPAVRNAIDGLGRNVMLAEVRPLSDFMNDSLIMLRVVSTLTGLFGLLALVLAVIGVFSVINYSTSRRTREIGIRLALGEQRADILRMIMKEALFIVGSGVVAGMVMSLVTGRLIASFMFANSRTDTYVYVAVALTLIAMLACLIPAYKATKVNPSDALRLRIVLLLTQGRPRSAAPTKTPSIQKSLGTRVGNVHLQVVESAVSSHTFFTPGSNIVRRSPGAARADAKRAFSTC